MIIYSNEGELLKTLDKYEELILQCVNGETDFWSFVEAYGSFYGFYALDGHESDREERAILLKHELRIEVHRCVTEETLGMACTEEDVKNPLYPQHGRFGPDVAYEKLRDIAEEYLNWATEATQK